MTRAEKLFRMDRMHVEFIPPAAHICIAIGSCVGCRRPVDIRELCKAVSVVLRRSNEVHIDYFIRFSGKQSGECESCNRQHRTGEEIPLHSSENLIEESQRTGKLFPG